MVVARRQRVLWQPDLRDTALPVGQVDGLVEVRRLCVGVEQHIELFARAQARLEQAPQTAQFALGQSEVRLQLRDEFRRHIAQSQMAVLWVTHDEAEARAMGEVGMRLQDGTLQAVW